MKKLFLLSLILLGKSFAAMQQEIKTYKFNFTKGEHFKVAYADYPQGQEQFYELKHQEHAKLPKEIVASHQHGLKISGNNHSDDLFMYAYKKISDLKPNTQYHVTFSLEFASNAPLGATGVGGSPGDSVYVKIGLINHKPERTLDEAKVYRMALDKGNQAQDGKDMLLIGTVGVETQNALYRLKTLPYLPDDAMQEKLIQYRVTTDDQGQAWVVFGTDSGFEATSTLFYTNLTIGFTQVI